MRKPGGKTIIIRACRLIALLSACLLAGSGAVTQDKLLKYSILRNGSSIGEMVVRENRDSTSRMFDLQSSIATRMLVRITATANEEARFDNGILKHCTTRQVVNGTTRVNSSTRKTASGYLRQTDGKEVRLPVTDISFSMICLYSVEPEGISMVYSDKYGKFLAIEKKAEHQYSLRFPDGSQNEYYYSGGICTRIKASGKLFTVIMELKNSK